MVILTFNELKLKFSIKNSADFVTVTEEVLNGKPNFCAVRVSSEFLKQPPELLYKKGVLKNFIKFTGEHRATAS